MEGPKFSSQSVLQNKQIRFKAKLGVYPTLVRMAVTKKINNNNYWRGSGEEATLTPRWWECTLGHSRHLWNKANLITVNDLLDVSFSSVCKYFIEKKILSVHQGG